MPPPSLQSLPNELKQLIIAELYPVIPPPPDEILQFRNIQNIRLVSKNLCDNAAFIFEASISNVRVGCDETSLNRLIKGSEHPYIRQHVKIVTISLKYCFREDLNDMSNQSHAPCLKILMQSPERMLNSGFMMLKLSTALKALPNCISVVIEGCWSQEETRVKTECVPDSFVILEIDHSFSAQIISAAMHAVTYSGIQLHSLKVNEPNTLRIGLFAQFIVDRQLILPAFRSLTSLTLDISCIDASVSDISDFALFLNSIPSVQCLELSLSPMCYKLFPKQEATSQEIFQNVHLPNIRRLVLRETLAHARSLENFLLIHKDHLRIVELINVHFLSIWCWPNFMERLIGKLKLERLAILSPFCTQFYSHVGRKWAKFYYTHGFIDIEGDIDAELRSVVDKFVAKALKGSNS